MKNEVGLKHIAIELGVSLTTVSRALSDAPDISEGMKAKVRQKAIELKYTPNQFAKSLSTGRSNIIAIFVDSLVSPYFSLTVEMMARKIKEKGYSVFLFPIDHAYTQKEDIKTAIATGAEGIITFTIPRLDAIEIANLSSRPVLLFGRGCDHVHVNVLYTDDVEGGYLAAKYLHEKGHEKLLYLSGSVNEVSDYRFKGFSLYCQEHGLQYTEYAGEEIHDAYLPLFEQGCTGVFAFDDQLASVFRWDFPQKEIHIIGFNGLRRFPTMPISYSGFPSISGNYEEMVEDAINVIVEQIEGKSQGCVKKKYKVNLVE
ncbi:MAG: LacI family DNA-binding transcriptional regulator [Candidatus Enteromonas sp.]|nr:LacI family DNA-binding transcriptional regulator [Candidatus Enteromonas sp.]